jgi:phosphatidylserine synthase
MENMEQRIRKVLLAGASVFGLSAILLVALPGVFNGLLGLATNGPLEWSMRMVGSTLVALAGNMFSVSRWGTWQSVRFSGRLMQISAFLLGVLTLLMPGQQTWFSISYAVVGFGFSAAYTWALFKKA